MPHPKKTNYLFKSFAILLMLDVIFSILATLELGVPHNSISSWTKYQWHMINFLWTPVLISSGIYIIFIIFSLLKKYFVFPIAAIFISLNLPHIYGNILQILTDGFINPISNFWGMIALIEILFGIFGTYIWIKHLLKKS